MLRCRWLAWLALLACGLALAGVPERPRFRIAGPPQGLPSTEIEALARDADGYLWIATADGLARYDGIDMRVWRHDPQDPAGLPGNNVQALVRNDAQRNTADLYSVGWNNAYKGDNGWSAQLDLSYSRTDRSELSFESYAGTGRGRTRGANETIGFAPGMPALPNCVTIRLRIAVARSVRIVATAGMALTSRGSAGGLRSILTKALPSRLNRN